MVARGADRQARYVSDWAGQEPRRAVPPHGRGSDRVAAHHRTATVRSEFHHPRLLPRQHNPRPPRQLQRSPQNIRSIPLRTEIGNPDEMVDAPVGKYRAQFSGPSGRMPASVIGLRSGLVDSFSLIPCPPGSGTGIFEGACVGR